MRSRYALSCWVANLQSWWVLKQTQVIIFIITPHDRQSIMLMMLVKEECVYLQGSLHMYACICLVYNTYKHVYVHTNLIICSCSFQPGRDAKGAALALFTARLHRPDVTTHKAVLQAIIYQLDKAIERWRPQALCVQLFLLANVAKFAPRDFYVPR